LVERHEAGCPTGSRYVSKNSVIPNLEAYAKEKKANAEELMAGFKSQLYAHRWERACVFTKENRADFSKFLADYRGLSMWVFRWLIDNEYITAYESVKTTKFGKTFEDLEIAFPVSRPVNWNRWPIESDTEFLGMHLKWIKDSENSGWRYEPKAKGIGSVPLIMGDPQTADLVVIAESTWDPIAFMDCYKLHKADFPWAAIITRGASNGEHIPTTFKDDASLLLLTQNDVANDKWYRSLPEPIRARARSVVPPQGCKDFNDWMKIESAENIQAILKSE